MEPKSEDVGHEEDVAPQVENIEQQAKPANNELDDSNQEKMANVVAFAKSASDKEHKMSLLQGIKLYPKAIAWSILISTCIAMEGYDISLVNNFCTFRDALG